MDCPPKPTGSSTFWARWFPFYRRRYGDRGCVPCEQLDHDCYPCKPRAIAGDADCTPCKGIVQQLIGLGANLELRDFMRRYGCDGAETEHLKQVCDRLGAAHGILYDGDSHGNFHVISKGCEPVELRVVVRADCKAGVITGDYGILTLPPGTKIRTKRIATIACCT